MKNAEIDQFQYQLLNWYKLNHRKLPWRETSNPYFIWLSEVMLQQTQVKTVIPYFKKFTKALPSVSEAASASGDQMLKLWEGLGYYSRIRNFHKAVKTIVTEFNGQIPSDWDTFIRLPGVGNYIASAVLSMAYHQPFAVVDGNVKRVLARLCLLSCTVNEAKNLKFFQTQADKLLAKDQSGNYNQAIMELGALICKPGNPDCKECPVQSFCMAFKKEKTEQFPRKKRRNPVPIYDIAVGVIYEKGKLLITKRKSEG